MPRKSIAGHASKTRNEEETLRFALMSDVHGNLAALRAVAACLADEGPLDHVVVAGDHLQAGAHPGEVWDFLTGRGWVLIRGNEDDSLLDDTLPSDRLPAAYRNAFLSGRDWTRGQVGTAVLESLAALPEKWRIATPAGDLLVVHASPRSIHDRAGAGHNTAAEVFAAYGGTGASAIAFGHYHRHFVRMTPYGLLINVASVGLPLDKRPIASYTVLTAQQGDWLVEQHEVPYDPSSEETEAVRRGLPPWIPDEA